MPLTDEQFARLAALTTGDTLRPSHVGMIGDLLAELGEWRALVAEFVAPPTSDSRTHWQYDGAWCSYCDAPTNNDEPPTFDHTPDCPVGRAQAKLKEVEG